MTPLLNSRSMAILLPSSCGPFIRFATFLEYNWLNHQIRERRVRSDRTKRSSLRPTKMRVGRQFSAEMIRLFNCNTFQAFISRDLNKQHTKPINQLRYSRDGRMFVSCSKDGAIKLWDGVTNLCVKTIMDAHSGEEVSSVAFSRDGSVLLSGGKDSASKIWDVASGRELTNFQGCKQSNYRLQTVFAPDENYVFSCDERTYNVVAWDRNSGDIVREFSGHNKVIHWVAVSPSEEAFLSCSGDFRARFWVADQL
eukprot:725092_1